MDSNEYFNKLKKVNIGDIIQIIKTNLDKKGEFIALGFREFEDIVLFGELNNGWVTNPSIFVSDNKDNACEDLYNALQSEFKGTFEYGHVHNFTGENDYFGYTDEKTGNNLAIYF